MLDNVANVNDRCLELSSRGFSLSEISERLGISRSAVAGRLYRQREAAERDQSGPPRKIDGLEEKVAQMYASGISMHNIARTLRVPDNSVTSVIDAYVAEGKLTRRRAVPKPLTITEEQLDSVKCAYQNGQSLSQIAALIGITREEAKVAYDRLRRHGKIMPFHRATAVAYEAPEPKITRPELAELPLSFVAAGNEGIELMALSLDHCRWPLQCEDGVTRFCGDAPRELDRGHSAYCWRHHAIAYRPTPVLKRLPTN